jgi:uncharacterized protein
MKLNSLACAFLLLLSVVVQLRAQPVMNPTGVKTTATMRIAVKNPDGSFIGANFDWDANFIDELVSMPTNAVTTTNKFFIENKVLAEKGDSTAEVGLGYRYFTGLGVPKDFAEAAKWFLKAANQGNILADRNLGACCANGFGVPKDETEATKWYHKAAIDESKETIALAEQGDASAQLQVGFNYLFGQLGVPKDSAEAVKWMRKSAEQGNVDALNQLAGIYDEGFGVPQDYAEAAKWYRKAAEQGDAFAQNNLGVMYRNGEGLPQDFVEAYKWYNLAAAQGSTNAIHNRDKIVEFMTPDQIAEAQQLSSEFKPHKEGSNNSISSDQPTASGTGFFITDDGFLVTCAHVVKGAAQIKFVTGAGTVSAKVVQVDAANDLALLKADGRFAPLPISPSRSAQLGSTVATIGFPDPGLQGFAPKLAKGEIASLAGAGDDARYFQISVPVQPGNSGGALVDEHGNVIGIVSAKLDASAALAASGALPENVNYAVKSSFLLSFLESVPEVDAKLKAVNSADKKFEDVVKDVQSATVLVLVY